MCTACLFCSATFFVEYQFPAALLNTKKSSHRQHHLHEVMRIACKKMKAGRELSCSVPVNLYSSSVCSGVIFNHRSVFPVLPNSKVLQSWWHSSLIFRVYCRPAHERMVRAAPPSPTLTMPAPPSAGVGGQGCGLPEGLAAVTITTVSPLPPCALHLPG